MVLSGVHVECEERKDERIVGSNVCVIFCDDSETFLFTAFIGFLYVCLFVCLLL